MRPYLLERVGIAAINAFAQALGLFPEMFEGRVVRQRTCWHRDLRDLPTAASCVMIQHLADAAIAPPSLRHDWWIPGCREDHRHPETRRVSRPAGPPRRPHHERPERRAGRHDDGGHARVPRGGDHRRVLLLPLRLAGRRDVPPDRRRGAPGVHRRAGRQLHRPARIGQLSAAAHVRRRVRGRAAQRARRPDPRAAGPGSGIGRLVLR